MRSKAYALAIAASLFLTTALAHEFWLEFPRLRLQPGEAMNFRLLVGSDFAGKPWRNQPGKVLRLLRYGPADSTSLTPAPTDTLNAAVRFAQPGTHLLALSTADSFIELPGPQFTAYLREEGLDYILKKRQELGHADQPGRETYRRRAKALVQVGGPNDLPVAQDTAYRRVLNLPLELVPEQNPYRLVADKSLTVRVLRQGKPVSGAQVNIWQRQPGGLPTTHFSTRSNQNGRILLRLTGPGPYLLAAVDMQPAPAALRARAEWQSTWASLTFGGPTSVFRPAGGKR
ncbi:DUF4198 domain-containing protein [Hymenobacter sp. ASUV-10]|uniref:DUF4198 domain-containing protein n=1 Tax=Hymenobacter aranciens TaxID=3063996 RepID=A0ABT9BBP4_9BACT|nr:DUF4198 domain-containing protein [Hymenobacter sp. ASUV-10]MDO7875690.1 DUF4198 domain-containing protein [Hymenobacter sp. ASUV-10]